MTDAPERIWASPEWRREDQGNWWDVNLGGDSEEYIRADKVAALVKAAERLTKARERLDDTLLEFCGLAAALAALKGSTND